MLRLHNRTAALAPTLLSRMQTQSEKLSRPLMLAATRSISSSSGNNGNKPSEQNQSLAPHRRRDAAGRDLTSSFFTSPFERMWSRALFPRDFFEDFEELVPELMNTRGGRRGDMTFRPRINVSETDNAVTVHAEVPGMKKEDIQVEVKDDTLVLRGEKQLQKKEEDKEQKFTRIESTYGSFERRVPLPEGVDPASIKAKYNDGVLEIEVPKPEEVKKKSATIEII